jgi:hypothetical protein
MNTTLEAPTKTLDFLPLDLELDVAQRLSQLQSWTAAWQDEDEQLQQRVMNLNPARPHEVLLSSQIANLRRQLVFQVAQIPIYLDPDVVCQAGIATLRQHLTSQYADLSLAERRLWLTNLFFLLTPTLRALVEKLEKDSPLPPPGTAALLSIGRRFRDGEKQFTELVHGPLPAHRAATAQPCPGGQDRCAGQQPFPKTPV